MTEKTSEVLKSPVLLIKSKSGKGITVIIDNKFYVAPTYKVENLLSGKVKGVGFNELKNKK